MSGTPSDPADPPIDDAALPLGDLEELDAIAAADAAAAVPLGDLDAFDARPHAEGEDFEQVLAGSASVSQAGHGRRTSRVVLISALSIVLVLVLSVVGGGLWIRHWLGTNVATIADPFAGISTRAPQQTVADGKAPATNILILGTDSRISTGDPSRWESGAQRTDTMMLMQVSGDRQKVSVMSIPRDTWVDIPGYGQGKINAAYAHGGLSLSIQTVEALTGVRIHHVAIADFNAFTALTDQIGGVDIELKEPQTLEGTEFPAGVHRLNGKQALAYTRERQSLSGGDLDRVKRQQAWVRAIVTQVKNNGTLSSPTRFYSFMTSAAHTVAVDESFSPAEMQSLAWDLRDVNSENIKFMTAPVSGTSTSADGQSIVVLDQSVSEELFAAFAEDRVEEYLAANPDKVELLPLTVD